MRQVMRRQHKALSTEASYLHWLSRYLLALNRMPSALTSEQKLDRFLTDLAVKRDVSASTQNQAINASVFFYKNVLGSELHNIDALRATRPVRLRHAPTVAETRSLLNEVRDIAGYPTSLVGFSTVADSV